MESIRRSGISVRFYQASSSEMFGNSPPPQDEDSYFMPRSPYGVSKVFAYHMARNYRDAYKLFFANGILFNHESPRRGETFVTRKISRAIASILARKQEYLYLGNLEAQRDWGFAPDYVEVMWRILQQPQPQDFVVGTGQPHSVREFLEESFSYVGLDCYKFTKRDPRYLRPTEADNLVANPKKARRVLKWHPRVGFKDLVKIMVDADMRKAGLKPPGDGDEFLRTHFPNRWWKID